MSSIIKMFKDLITSDVEKLEKSIVGRCCTSSFFAVQNSNIVLLGEELPSDAIDEVVPSSGKFIILIAKGDNGWDITSISVEILDDKGSAAEAQDRAISLVEGGRNTVQYAVVCRGINKTFAGRPVYQSFAQYTYINKEEAAVLDFDPLVNIIKIYDTVDSLPAAVRKLDPKKQRQFMHVWNSAYAKTKNETTSFKEAWGVVNRVAVEKSEPSPSDVHVDELEDDICPECEKSPCCCTDKLEKSESFEHFVEIKKSSLVDGYVYGIVYEPLTKDTHGDWSSAAEIERWANDFLPCALRNGTWTDKNHNEELKLHDVEIAQSYIAPCDFNFPNGEKVIKGSWVLVSKVNSMELRKAIENGEITGYSLEGVGRRIAAELPKL
jgi:hypothetical protein